MLAAVKAAVDAQSTRRVAAGGAPLELVVRVPPTVEGCERLGIEICEWIRGGLADVVVAGEGWLPNSSPVDEFVALAAEAAAAANGKRPLVLGPFEALNRSDP